MLEICIPAILCPGLWRIGWGRRAEIWRDIVKGFKSKRRNDTGSMMRCSDGSILRSMAWGLAGRTHGLHGRQAEGTVAKRRRGTGSAKIAGGGVDRCSWNVWTADRGRIVRGRRTSIVQGSADVEVGVHGRSHDDQSNPLRFG